MTIPNSIIESILKDVIKLYLIPKHIDLGMKATGEWIESLEVQGNTIRGRKYTEQLVYGRKPNDDQDSNSKRKWAYGMANFNPAFKKWLQVRGLSEYGVQIAYTIADSGTKYYKQGGTDLLEVLESKQVIDYINERLGKYITAEATLELRRQLQTL